MGVIMDESFGEYGEFEEDNISEDIYEKLNDDNKFQYILEIDKYLYKYLFDGKVSFKSNDIANLFKLKSEELEVLKTIHFLLNDNVKELFEVIPHLLRNLAHSTNKEDIECRGVIRGNINWNKTIKYRFSKGFNDPSLFICSPPLKHYDLIENRILKFILKKIIFLFQNYLTFINTKKSNINFKNLNEIYESWYDQVKDIYNLSIHTLRNVYFNDISDLESVSAQDLNKLFHHRNNLYHKVAKVFDLYEKLFIIEDRFSLINVIRNQIIVATDNDTLFEIYVLFNVISNLEKNSIEDSFEMGLMYRHHNNPVKAKLKDGNIVKVYYQNMPDVFKENSLYRLLTGHNEFNFPTYVRRPDLIVEIVNNEGNSFHRIIEVKNSSSYDYMRKSFYKVLAYYKDFEQVPFVENIPIVVVNWNGSSIDVEQKEKIFKEKIIFFNKNEFLKNITKLLEF